ncbi:hypothetical protein HN385_06340 [archaeon]|jgi:hypothetical protein|nr:hypothetical protein [archaeon]
MQFEKLKETVLFKDAETSIKMKIYEIRGILKDLTSITNECENDEAYLEFTQNEQIELCDFNDSSNSICI